MSNGSGFTTNFNNSLTSNDIMSNCIQFELDQTNNDTGPIECYKMRIGQVGIVFTLGEQKMNIRSESVITLPFAYESYPVILYESPDNVAFGTKYIQGDEDHNQFYISGGGNPTRSVAFFAIGKWK